jgi:hypothetical protein
VAALVAIVLGASLFWLWKTRNGNPGTSVHIGATATTTASPTWISTEITPPAEALFYDAFINNSHGWSLASNDGYFRILVNNTLILADTNPNTPLIESVPTSTNLDDYVISADFTINQGDVHDGLGIYLRGDSTLDHDYRVDINGNNTIDVAKEWLDTKSTSAAQSTMLIPPETAYDLHPPGQQNTLTVIMLGHTLTIEINNAVLKTVSDSSYTNGQIALFARHGSSSRGVTVSFSRVEIDRLASPFATPIPTPIPTLTPTASTP